MVRPPAVAGRFYSNQPDELSRQVRSFWREVESRHQAIACVVPHAGYRFSGHVAGAVYSRLALPSRFLLIGPRHFPHGAAQAILSEGAWKTPFGLAEIDSALATELKQSCPVLTEDPVAHQAEHSLEVQLPFLQELAGEFRFVPIVLGVRDYDALESLGEAIAAVLLKTTGRVLIIASSDMNHYESDEITRRKDRSALDRLIALDPRGLFEVVRGEGITMCGVGPVVATLVAARLLGATRANLVRYATSGDISGDYDEVVGYAGVIVD